MTVIRLDDLRVADDIPGVAAGTVVAGGDPPETTAVGGDRLQRGFEVGLTRGLGAGHRRIRFEFGLRLKPAVTPRGPHVDAQDIADFAGGIVPVDGDELRTGIVDHAKVARRDVIGWTRTRLGGGPADGQVVPRGVVSDQLDEDRRSAEDRFPFQSRRNQPRACRGLPGSA